MDVIHKTTAIMMMMAQMYAKEEMKNATHHGKEHEPSPTGEAAIPLQ